MTTQTTMTKKRAAEIITENARAAARDWLDQAISNAGLYYLIESVSTSGMFRKITLAVCKVDDNGRNVLEFFWPNADGSHPETDDAIKALGSYSDALAVASGAVGFSLKRRCFAVSGCGMDMVFATVNDLASFAYRGIPDDEYRAKVNAASNVSRTSMSRVD